MQEVIVSFSFFPFFSLQLRVRSFFKIIWHNQVHKSAKRISPVILF